MSGFVRSPSRGIRPRLMTAQEAETENMENVMGRLSKLVNGGEWRKSGAGFSIGQIVTTTSSDQRMSVSNVWHGNDGQFLIECQWFDDVKQSNNANFYPEELRKV